MSIQETPISKKRRAVGGTLTFGSQNPDKPTITSGIYSFPYGSWTTMRTFALLALAMALNQSSAAAQVDIAASKVLVHVEKSGLFAAFAHNHVIAAPLASAQLDIEKKTVEVHFRSQDMKVL